VADDLGARSMAFPAISTGIYGFPKELAAEIALSTLGGLDTKVGRVILVAFDPETLSIYDRRIPGLLPGLIPVAPIEDNYADRTTGSPTHPLGLHHARRHA
jgi:hypothetical protein